jgi:hypothetical protein
MRLFYDPQDPETAIVAGFFSLWGLSTFFGAEGVVLLFTGVMMPIRLTAPRGRLPDPRSGAGSDPRACR